MREATRRTIPLLLATLAAAAAPGWLAAQQPLGQIFDRAFPSVVQVLVASPDSVRQGSGFVVDSVGTVLTHLTLVEGASTIFVRPATDESYYRASVAAADSAHGIAALVVEGAGVRALELTRTDALHPGARVTAIGLALESDNPVARAVVGDPVEGGAAYELQAVPPLSPGLSGGPLLDADGSVVGMVVAREEEGRTRSVAVPIERTRRVLALAGGGRPREAGVAGAQTAARSSGAPAPQPPTATPPALPDRAGGARAPVDLTGEWLLTNTIQQTSYPAFRGLQLGFRLSLRQRGDRVTGQGRKVLENGRELAPAARSLIKLEGTLQDHTLTATFVEHGARRTIHGLFSWFVSPDGDELGGRFADTAVHARGASIGRRVP
ncbi:MAG: trypsin-like peptidase domain-containing protein [Gemmatimonadota bacterium]